MEYTKEEIITSNNFARNSDVVFSEFIDNREFKKLKNIDDKVILNISNGLTTYFTKKFSIKNGDIIFCKTEFIHILFKKLNENKKNVPNNLILISSQSDIKIDKKLFKQKPKCISKWFSINVSHDDADLIPIPLGLPETRNTKNIIYEDFSYLRLKFEKKTEKIFSNFNLNTRYFHRYKYAKTGLDNTDFIIQKANSNYIDYLNSLSKYKYTLCPWGNGYDTHRLWESLYSKSIPITTGHIAFKNFKDLPIIFINDYEQINLEYLRKYTFNNLNLEKLNINWWINLIASNKKESDNKIYELQFRESEIEKIINKYNSIFKLSIFLKKLYTFCRRCHIKIFGRKLNKFIGM